MPLWGIGREHELERLQHELECALGGSASACRDPTCTGRDAGGPAHGETGNGSAVAVFVAGCVGTAAGRIEPPALPPVVVDQIRVLRIDAGVDDADDCAEPGDPGRTSTGNAGRDEVRRDRGGCRLWSGCAVLISAPRSSSRPPTTSVTPSIRAIRSARALGAWNSTAFEIQSEVAVIPRDAEESHDRGAGLGPSERATQRGDGQTASPAPIGLAHRGAQVGAFHERRDPEVPCVVRCPHESRSADGVYAGDDARGCGGSDGPRGSESGCEGEEGGREPAPGAHSSPYRRDPGAP